MEIGFRCNPVKGCDFLRMCRMDTALVNRELLF
jgi:hypothetical protein